MCDYSLCGLTTRLASEGEELVVHRFRTGSMGLASVAELSPAGRTSAHAPRKSFWKNLRSFLFEDPAGPGRETAVCIPPGAELTLKNIPEDLQRKWNIKSQEDTSFVQITANVYSYRDAVRFSNGTEVLLQSLREGMPVQVMSLSNVQAESERDLAAPVL